MDILLSKVTQQAMNYAIRSGITITSTYAISQCSRLLKTKVGREREELGNLQRRLEGKIRIISPAIDMIELITARGNTSLESAVALTKSLRWDIQALGVRLSRAATDEEASRRKSSREKSHIQRDIELKMIIADMRELLEKIEDAVPLINLAITTSGVSLSTNLPPSISPSRLLQASTFLSAGDARYVTDFGHATQIGPTFTLSIYMLFGGHAFKDQNEEGLRSTIWQEVIHKAKVKLLRTALSEVEDLPSLTQQGFLASKATPNSDDFTSQTILAERRLDEFAYQILLVEDLEDDRVHTFDDEQQQPTRFDEVTIAGIREIIPIHQISRIFYADTGKILNIGTDGETNNPILLLKRDTQAAPPRRMMKSEEDELSWTNQYSEVSHELHMNPDQDEHSVLEAQFARESTLSAEGEPPTLPSAPKPWRFPPGLDPEWIALEVYDESLESDSELDENANIPGNEDESDSVPERLRQSSLDSGVSSALSRLRLGSEPVRSSPQPSRSVSLITTPEQLSKTPNVSQMPHMNPTMPIRTSLSLMEMLIRLTSLQQFQQASHLTINDELLNFFLEESSTTGAAPGDAEARKRIRMQAREHVGFDPYDESPIKRRGEKYQHHGDVDNNQHDRQWTPSPHAEPRSSRNDSASPLCHHGHTLLGSSRYATPLRQVVYRTNRDRATPSSVAEGNHSSLATPSRTAGARPSSRQPETPPSEQELSRRSPNPDSPLPSVEVEIPHNV